MLRLGLTGGIASGKSTVAGMLRELGFHVLDADSLAHQVIEPGQPGYEEVVGEFGSSIIAGSGKIDRGKLGGIVFSDHGKLEKLNAIVHPRVEEEIVRQFREWQNNGVDDAAFVEAALLVEAGYHKKLDGLVVAWCKPEQQLERLKTRGMTELEAQQRIAAQMPVNEKLKFATDKIDCSGTLQKTKDQVQQLAHRLKGKG